MSSAELILPRCQLARSRFHGDARSRWLTQALQGLECAIAQFCVGTAIGAGAGALIGGGIGYFTSRNDPSASGATNSEARKQTQLLEKIANNTEQGREFKGGGVRFKASWNHSNNEVFGRSRSDQASFSFIIPQIKQASSLASAVLATLALLPRKSML